MKPNPKTSTEISVGPRKSYMAPAMAATLVLSAGMTWSETLTIAAADFHAARKFVETPFGKIAYVERGNGPVALFVHGALLNGYQWRHQLAGLTDIRRCIALDTLGMGYTEVKPGQSLAMKDQAQMIAAFLDALKIDKVDLIGNDSGGGTAQIFAANHPERIRSLTLTNCEVHEYDKDNPAGEQLRSMVESGMLRALCQQVVTDPVAGAPSLAVAYEHPERITPETFKMYLEPIVSTDERAKGMEQYFLSTTSADLLEVEDKLKALDAPMLVIWGMADTFFDKKWATWLQANRKNVREVVAVETGLVFFPEEYPDLVNESLRRFWSAD